MFSKLISRFQEKKSDHPLGSEENLDALISGISLFDPTRLLLDVDHALDGIDSCIAEVGSEAALRALHRLDQHSRAGADELLVRYLTSGKREYLADSVWSTLESHAALLFRGYSAALETLLESSAARDKQRLAGGVARAMRAWAVRKKLQHFRYRRPGAELWRDAHKLLQVARRLDVLQTGVVPYRDERESTPLREYVTGLYFEFVPVGNMVPQQLELADGFLRSCDNLELSPEPYAHSTDRIDIAADRGPQRIKSNDPVGDGIRYCSVLKLRVPLMQLAGQIKRPAEAPTWLTRLPGSPELISDGLMTLMTYWASKPPKRSKDRIDQKVELRTVLGFGLARRMVAVSQFARVGRAFRYEGHDLERLFDEYRFGRVPSGAKATDIPAVAPEPETSTPQDILRKLELRGDQAQMESWTQVDASETGFGVIVPALLPRHRIGLLVCLRNLDGIDWRLGIVRRMGRDPNNRPSVGIEALPWPSLCAQAKSADDPHVWAKIVEGAYGWIDAIIVSREGKELMLPAGTFVAGLEVDIRSEDGPWRVRLESLLDSGPDYDRIEFTRLS